MIHFFPDLRYVPSDNNLAQPPAPTHDEDGEEISSSDQEEIEEQREELEEAQEDYNEAVEEGYDD